MRLELESPPSVRAGDTVRFTLRLHNPGSAPVAVGLFAPVPDHDVLVTTLEGTRVWSRLGGRAVAAAQTVVTIRPGGSLTFEIPWDQTESPRRDPNPMTFGPPESDGISKGGPVRTGSYVVTGRLTVQTAGFQGRAITVPRRLEILPRP